MANHPSALKAMRQNQKKRLRNMSYRSMVKTAVKQYVEAAEKKDNQAEQLFRRASSLLQKGVSKGIYHKNTASRTIARLARRLPTTER